MKNELIKINEKTFTKDFHITENTVLSFVINENYSTELSFSIEENAKVIVKILDMGSSNFKCRAKINGANISYSLFSFAIVKGSIERHSDIRIEIPVGSTNCIASECEEAFLLDDNSRNIATLSVLAREKESIANHNYSCNYISNKQLEFLAARGLIKENATQTILQAKIDRFLSADFNGF